MKAVEVLPGTVAGLRCTGASRRSPPPGFARTQVVETLQRRVKILEAQNIKLRLAKAEAEASAELGSKSGRGAAHSGQPARAHSEGEAALAGEGSAAGENRPPNDAAAGEAAAADGAAERSGRSTRSMLEGNPVLEKWEADKRLQKRVEALQGKLRVSAPRPSLCATPIPRCAALHAMLGSLDFCCAHVNAAQGPGRRAAAIPAAAAEKKPIGHWPWILTSSSLLPAPQDKAQQLATSHAARERLAQQVTQLQAELASARAAAQKHAAAARLGPAAAEHPGPVVPPCIQVRRRRVASGPAA